tara:strand:+ start:2250 stop:2495 length:246 start_codon:yes stop_codon:yes gene_type:complete
VRHVYIESVYETFGARYSYDISCFYTLLDDLGNIIRRGALPMKNILSSIGKYLNLIGKYSVLFLAIVFPIIMLGLILASLL